MSMIFKGDGGGEVVTRKGAPDDLSLAGHLLDGFPHRVDAHESAERGTLATGDYQAVYALQMFG